MTFKSQLSVALYDSKSLADRIEGLLIEHGGEVTPELESLINFQAVRKEDLQVNVDCTLGALDRLTRAIDYYKDQILELQKLQKAITATRERLEGNLMASMESFNLDALEGRLTTVKIRSNPPKVDVVDETSVPAEFKKITIVEDIDKKAISEALKSGALVPGTRLISTKRLVRQKRKDFDDE